MRILTLSLLLLPVFSFAKTSDLKPIYFNGGALYCKSHEDLGKVGYLLQDLSVKFATADKQKLSASFLPKFYACAQNAEGFFWQDSSVDAALNYDVQTKDGVVKIVAVSYKWVTYTEYYKVLAYTQSADGRLNFQFKTSELLKSQKNKGFLVTFLSAEKKAVYPDGSELELSQVNSATTEVGITLPSR